MKSRDIYMLVMARSQRIVHGLTDYNAPVLDPEDCLDVVSPAPVARRVQQCPQVFYRKECSNSLTPTPPDSRSLRTERCCHAIQHRCNHCRRLVLRKHIRFNFADKYCANGCDWRACE